MKIVVAPASFKGTLSAGEAADAIASGIRGVLPSATILRLPIADGGEGTIEALTSGRSTRFLRCRVHGPLYGRKVTARCALIDNGMTAVIEMSSASGLTLLPPSFRHPLSTTTYGTGELVRRAMDAGARKILVGLGGSATVDGGTGMARALGARFLDSNGKSIGWGGGALSSLSRIDLSAIDPRVAKTEIVAVADVRTPLTGRSGAARLFAPQKGANPRETSILAENLRRLASAIERDLGRNVRSLRGGGAAGGLGAGMAAFLDARIVDGAPSILDAIGFHRAIRGADLLIAGEGRFDRTSNQGKAPFAAIRAARSAGIPIALICGSFAAPPRASFCSLVDIAGSLPRAMRSPRRFLRKAAENVIRQIVGDALRRG
ncbi:MAG: hypothetical protein A2Z34_02370 [Planctomycetes bacterium RBG_16_59_8]|nr:MAG: hypothetical protein A2Z34_02370 [Planctomycetes bacterium RBG_16_59_8]